MKNANTEKRIKKKSMEITGVILFALSLFLLLCLVSYSSSDPSFTHFVSDKTHTKNMGGFVGSYVSAGLLGFFGLSAYLFPVLLIVISFKLFLSSSFKCNAGTIIGFAGIAFSLSAVLTATYNTVTLAGNALKPGGTLGVLSTEFLYSYLNHFGTYILLIVVLAVSLIITFDISLISLIKRTIVIAGRMLGALRSFLVIRAERFKRKKKITSYKKTKVSADAPRIDEKLTVKSAVKPSRSEQVAFEFEPQGDTFVIPPLTVLDKVEVKDLKINRESLVMNARLLEKKLADFGVEGKVMEVQPGPVITMYELEPAPGVKINRITNLADDLALAMKAQGVRIVAPIPGKSVIGIEIPNQVRASVHLRDVLDNEEFRESKYQLAIGLGKDIVGGPVIADLAKMPHLLIAGTTGSGKSVSLNAMICSILFRAKPDDVKFIMIDPKRLELSSYEGIPHLLHPVVVNPKKASQVLKWAVDEMERRYKAISELGVKSIERYNRLLEKRGKTRGGEGSDVSPPDNLGETAIVHEKMPYIIIVIDELADLMMVAQRNVEESLARLAQMARAAGIHLILATQRPSVDVITGVIKANFPIRISFQVSSKVDSRTILDYLGAEKLLGSGDMLYVPPGGSKLMRIHGAFVSDKEIERITEFIRKQSAPSYDESITQYSPESREGKTDEDFDERYDEAVELVTDLGQASISLVQRYLKVGYNRAARMIERMEAEGVVGPSDGVKPRKVLANKLPE
ncbi:MAG: DNA translocase FtsK 4TM domain-containing protein [Deltaproteobacteria bacterium]|nr:DNA translocase FtsK 4TM domain-containing protein [Deltaproteobacteria bacterium]